MMILKRRIEEIDIFKGILIILVVIGHATSQYNMYIYQFHMAAFFFISGFLSTIENAGFIKFVYKKFMSLKLPLFAVFILMQIFIALLYHSGNYNIFFDDNLQYYGFLFNLKEFIFRDTIYLWFLGAAWFVTVLFYIEIIKKIIYDIFNKNEYVSLIISLVVFLLGYYLALNNIHFLNIDLVFIGQLYYSIGFYLRKREYLKGKINNTYVSILLFAVSLCVMFFLGKINGITVDYPSRDFGNPIINIITALNGILWTYTFSILLKKTNYLKKLLSYFGENTLSILFFHFMFFKISFFILYIFNVVNFSYLRNFLPLSNIYSFSVLTVCLSIFFSLLLWFCLKKIQILKFLLGQDKIKSELVYNKLAHFFNNIFTKFKCLCFLKNICLKLKEQNNYIIFLFIISFLFISPELNITFVGKTLNTIKINGDYFYDDNFVGSGIEFEIMTGKQGVIILKGYLPNNLNGNEKLRVEINGELQYYKIENNSFDINIPSATNKKTNVRIFPNWSFKASPPDVRSLSFKIVDLYSK